MKKAAVILLALTLTGCGQQTWEDRVQHALESNDGSWIIYVSQEWDRSAICKGQKIRETIYTNFELDQGLMKTGEDDLPKELVDHVPGGTYVWVVR